uniref:CSON002553 protein n=1 Tax=Culicoides sonorensis TaxID=179676 RepID=A0A336KZH6_CULSO
MVEDLIVIIKTTNIFKILPIFFMIVFTSSIDIDSNCPGRLNQVFLKSAPFANSSAGKITEIPNVATLEICVEKCCNKVEEDCNVAFFFNKTCYHVQCHTNQACLPLKRNNITVDLAMMLVRPVADSTDSWMVSLRKFRYQQLLEHQSMTSSQRKLFEDDASNYGPYEDQELFEQKVKNMFRLGSNYPGELQYNDLEADESQRILETGMRNECEIRGINRCTEFEVCRRIREEAGRGFCECLPGYHRGLNNRCVKNERILENAIADRLTMQGVLDNADSVFLNNNADDESNEQLPNDKKKLLTVSVAPKEVKLPENEVALSAFVIPDEKTSGDKYTYLWTLISQPKPNGNGTMTDQSKDTVRLTNLSEGNYQFKCQVTGTFYYGEGLGNVTVLPANRINKAPQVMITPSFQTVKLPNHRGILDGSGSTDDGQIESYTWEIISAPIGYQSTKLDTNMLHSSMLQLDNLDLPGNYTFKLTVTDSEQKSNSTTATIEVEKEIDYPPNANAGNDIIIYYPQTNVTLNGNMSTDDHEITAWEWTKDSSTDQSKPVDMTLTRTPYLQLSNLEVGVYTFLLKVMDVKNQSSTSKVRVFVKPALTNEPNAVTGNNQTIILPQTWAMLNGTESTDDVKIERFQWKQVSGPSESLIVNSSLPFANATNLKVGNYVFQLTVFDNLNNNASALTNVTVKQEQNAPPVANAGGDQTITLPVSVVILNGSRSSDDLEITKWAWERDGTSLAMGTIIGNSSNEPVLMVNYICQIKKLNLTLNFLSKLTNVVPGRYVFKLTVSDAQGLSSSDTVSIFVNPDPLALNLVELTLTMEANSLMQSELDYLLQKVNLLLGDDIKVTVRDLKIDQKTGKLIAIFYATKGKSIIMPATDVEHILKEKFLRDYPILGSSVLEIRTSICQNNCSGHGACNSQTRVCMCDSFWLPDLWYFIGVEEPNCNWSILYVAVGVVLIFIIISGICFGITYFCRRRSVKKPRSRRPVQKYALLDTQEEESLNHFSKNSLQTFSEESDTESDILFETRSRNGILKANGDTNKSNGKYSMTRLGRRIKT